MPDVSFVGPQSLLNHVWINLIGNAVKFVKGDGSGRIIVRLTPNEKNVVVTVADNGIGMDDKTIAHIFEKFYQGDTSRRSSGNGPWIGTVQKDRGKFTWYHHSQGRTGGRVRVHGGPATRSSIPRSICWCAS